MRKTFRKKRTFSFGDRQHPENKQRLDGSPRDEIPSIIPLSCSCIQNHVPMMKPTFSKPSKTIFRHSGMDNVAGAGVSHGLITSSWISSDKPLHFHEAVMGPHEGKGRGRELIDPWNFKHVGQASYRFPVRATCSASNGKVIPSLAADQPPAGSVRKTVHLKTLRLRRYSMTIPESLPSLSARASTDGAGVGRFLYWILGAAGKRSAHLAST